MDKITVAELIKKMAKDKGMSIPNVAKKMNRFPQALYKTLNDQNIRTDLMLDTVEVMGEEMIVEYNGNKYKLIKK